MSLRKTHKRSSAMVKLFTSVYSLFAEMERVKRAAKAQTFWVLRQLRPMSRRSIRESTNLS